MQLRQPSYLLILVICAVASVYGPEVLYTYVPGHPSWVVPETSIRRAQDVGAHSREGQAPSGGGDVEACFLAGLLRRGSP